MAASRADRDPGHKLAVYEVWQVRDRRFPFGRLEGDHFFVPAPPDADGIWRSRVFPGRYLDLAALIRGDLAQALAVLQRELASAEPAAFLARLAESRG